MVKKQYMQSRGSSIDITNILLDDALFEAMYELLVQIGVFWGNTPKDNDLRSDLYTFMMNRITLDVGLSLIHI